MLIGLLYLILVFFGMGLGAWSLLGIKEEDQIMSKIMYLATGLIIFVQAGTLLGPLHLSTWWVYAVIAIALIAIANFKGKLTLEQVKSAFIFPKINKTWILIGIIFIFHFLVLFNGAISYQWLEDDDPWQHAAAVSYVSQFNTYLQPDHLPIHYLAPYPPFFDMLLGAVYQIDGGTMIEVLKFFNVLLISLSIPFFYAWAKNRFGEETSLWATFILACLPAFMGHFIWAQTLCMVLVFPALYFLDRCLKEKGKIEYIALTVLSIASVLITQPSTGAMFFGVLVAYIASEALVAFISKNNVIEQIKLPAIVFLVAFVLALAQFWVPMFAIYPSSAVLEKLSLSASILTDKNGDTGGGLIYSLDDFVNAPSSSKIDQATGIGLIASILMIIGVVSIIIKMYKEKSDSSKSYLFLIFAVLWLIYGFIGTEGNALPVKLVPHRFWVFLAPPVAIIAAFGVSEILNFVAQKYASLSGVVFIVLLIGVIYTSASPKYSVQNVPWPPGVAFVSSDQLSGLINLGHLPKGTNVFSYCMDDEFALAFTGGGYPWAKDVSDYRVLAMNDTVDNNYRFLKQHNYQYVALDQSCVKNNEPAQIQAKYSSLNSDSRFKSVNALTTKGYALLKVN